MQYINEEVPGGTHHWVSFGAVKASKHLNLLELFMNLIDTQIIFLFISFSREGFPYKSSLHKELSSKAEAGHSRTSLTLLRRMVRGPWKSGQRRKKCSGVSSSIPHLHLGSRQLNCFDKRCALRSLWSTRMHVNSLNPYLSLTPKILPFDGRIDERKFDLNLLKSKDFISVFV